MDNLRLTHERLRTYLNGDQPSRERMCLAVLALNRNYKDVQPRRPEGGRDGGRDLQCFRDSQLCFGAVGFMNNVSDSQQEKNQITKKFKDDVKSALEAEPKLRFFVFFTNIDLTPSEVEKLSSWGRAQGISFVDIHWRERICQVLNNAEGLALRYQYLSINLNEAEQAAFFSRFGSELESLVRGGFNSVESKIDTLAYLYWKAGKIRDISVELKFIEPEESSRQNSEHFRVMFQLYNKKQERYSLFIGGRDDFWSSDPDLFFDTNTFVSSFKDSNVDTAWLTKSQRSGGGAVRSLIFNARWPLRSSIPVEALELLTPDLYVTENLIERLDSVKVVVDSYVVIESKFVTESRKKAYILEERQRRGLPSSVGIAVPGTQWRQKNPTFEWPAPLTEEEAKLAWYRTDFLLPINLERIRLKIGSSAIFVQ